MDYRKQLKLAYDADAKRRDDNESNREWWKKEARKNFADSLKNQDGKTILEIGSGAGIDAKYFSKRGFDVLATDFSKQMLEMCKKRGLNTQILDIYELDKFNPKFDGIFTLNVLLHIPNQEKGKIIRNIKNCLNKDGLFYYGVYGGYDEESVFTDKTKMNLPRFFSFLSDDSLFDLVKEEFRIIEFKKYDIGKPASKLYFQSLLLKNAKT